MKYPNEEPFVIRTVYENTYETLLDYWLDTPHYESVGKVHTIWAKGKDPKKETIKELIDKIKVIPEEEGDMNKIEELVKKVVSQMYKND